MSKWQQLRKRAEKKWRRQQWKVGNMMLWLKAVHRRSWKREIKRYVITVLLWWLLYRFRWWKLTASHTMQQNAPIFHLCCHGVRVVMLQRAHLHRMKIVICLIGTQDICIKASFVVLRLYHKTLWNELCGRHKNKHKPSKWWENNLRENPTQTFHNETAYFCRRHRHRFSFTRSTNLSLGQVFFVASVAADVLTPFAVQPFPFYSAQSLVASFSFHVSLLAARKTF